MSNFYTLLTNIGAALHANAQVQQTTVAWTHFALGDGNGAAVVPTQTQTGLHREVHRLAITSIDSHPDNPNWIVVEAVVPSDVGGWTVRESAIYGGPGGNTCIAVGNYPETYKPVLAEGAGREMVMRMIVEISSVATVKLLIDPAVAIASREWVEKLHASTEKRGLVELATSAEAQAGTDAYRVVTTAALAACVATEARAGLVELATAAEVIAGADVVRVITPAGLSARTATEIRSGLVELATVAEAVSGLDTFRAVTPAGMKAALAATGVVEQMLLLQTKVVASEAAIALLNNRSWGDVSAHRLVGTAYQNLWGYQIAISVTTANSGALFEVSANGVNWIRLGKDGAERSQFYGDIPDRWWYRIIGGGSVDIWSQFA